MSEKCRLLGLDIGTTGIKAVVATFGHKVENVFRAATPWKTVENGREMRATDLFAAVDRLIDSAVSGSGMRFAGVGITSMGQSGSFFVPEGRAIAPIIAWNDSRLESAGAALRADIGEARYGAITGLPVGPGWTACHFRRFYGDRDIPEGAVWLGVAEAVAMHLTGKARTELSLACQSGLVDLSTKTWSDELLGWSGISRSAMPDVGSADCAVGRISEGKLADAHVVIAGHDHVVASVGAGATDSDTLFDSCGTAETIIRTATPGNMLPKITQIVAAGLQIGWHQQPDTMFVAASHGAGQGLERMRRLVGRPIEALAGAICTGDVTVDGILEPVFTLRASGGTPLKVWAAAQKSLAERTAGMSASIDRFCGPPKRTIVAGGWSRHPPFVAARRALFPDVKLAHTTEAGGLGAAIIAHSALS